MPIWIQILLVFLGAGGIVTTTINVVHEVRQQRRQLTNTNMRDINRQLQENNKLVLRLLEQHDKDQKKLDKLTEGVMLSLKNDMVIFDALKRGHINGESEIAKQDCNKFLLNIFKEA